MMMHIEPIEPESDGPVSGKQAAPAAPQEGVKELIAEETKGIGAQSMKVAEGSEHREKLLKDIVYFHVEDATMISRLSKMYLEQIGIQSAGSAETLEEALTKLEAALQAGTPLTLIVLDQVFPQDRRKEGEPAENFVKGLAALQARPEYKDALRDLRTLIFASGTATEEHRLKLQQLLPGYTILLLGNHSSVLK